MSDFVDGFWSLYVAGLTMISVIACAVLLTMQHKRPAPGQAVGTTGHQWDEDLAEYNNPLPKWWMWLFWITIVFGLLYLVLYPGLGAFKGVLGWTSTGQYQDEQSSTDAKFGPVFQKYAAMEIPAIEKDAQGKAMGERMLLTYWTTPGPARAWRYATSITGTPACVAAAPSATNSSAPLTCSPAADRPDLRPGGAGTRTSSAGTSTGAWPSTARYRRCLYSMRGSRSTRRSRIIGESRWYGCPAPTPRRTWKYRGSWPGMRRCG